MDEDEYNFEEEGTLASRAVTDWDESSLNGENVPLGIIEIDQKLGGIKPGSVVAVIADPRGVGELFGYHLASVAPSHYITTVRPKPAIEESFEDFRPTDGIPPYVEIQDTRRAETGPQQAVQNIFRRRDDKKNYIIDTFSALAGQQNFTQTIRQIYNSASEKEGITMLLFTADDDERFDSDAMTAIHLCDAVFTVQYKQVGNTRLQHYLEITKLRGTRQLPEEVLTLEVGNALSLDKTQTG